MEKILDGKITAQKIRKELKLEVDDLKTKGINPKLANMTFFNPYQSSFLARKWISLLVVDISKRQSKLLVWLPAKMIFPFLGIVSLLIILGVNINLNNIVTMGLIILYNIESLAFIFSLS